MNQLDKESSLNIIYLDNHLLVAVKESNLLTQDDPTSSYSLQTLLKKFLKEKFQKKGDVFLHPVHRLDKEVAGLVLFARTSKALSRLNEKMRENKIIRKYIAEVEGVIQEPKKELKDYLIHSSHRAKVVSKETLGAKPAHLSYRVIKQKKDSAILEVELFTGRYNQIRVQLSNIHHPIIGDKKYNSKIDEKKIHLQCCYLEFDHPVKNEKIKLEVKPFFN
jgi:23S rRNA pseudouridine1911/1915/1917 synthase